MSVARKDEDSPHYHPAPADQARNEVLDIPLEKASGDDQDLTLARQHAIALNHPTPEAARNRQVFFGMVARLSPGVAPNNATIDHLERVRSNKFWGSLSAKTPRQIIVTARKAVDRAKDTTIADDAAKAVAEIHAMPQPTPDAVLAIIKKLVDRMPPKLLTSTLGRIRANSTNNMLAWPTKRGEILVFAAADDMGALIWNGTELIVRQALDECIAANRAEEPAKVKDENSTSLVIVGSVMTVKEAVIKTDFTIVSRSRRPE